MNQKKGLTTTIVAIAFLVVGIANSRENAGVVVTSGGALGTNLSPGPIDVDGDGTDDINFVSFGNNSGFLDTLPPYGLVGNIGGSPSVGAAWVPSSSTIVAEDGVGRDEIVAVLRGATLNSDDNWSKVHFSSGDGWVQWRFGATSDVVTPLAFVRERTGVDLSANQAYQIAFGLAEPPLLMELEPTSGALFPGFSAETFAYSLTVPNGTTQISFTATRSFTGHLLAIRVRSGEYSSIESGEASEPLPLDTGSNLIEIRVTSTDASEQVYSISVTRLSPPQLTTSRARTFRTTSVGKRSKPQTIQVGNLGSSEATGITVRLVGSAARDFRTTQPAGSLAPGATTSFRLTFKPKAKGVRRSTLTVGASNAAARNVTVIGRGR